MWEWTSLLGGEKRLLLGKLPELFEKFLLSFKVERTKSLYIVCITLEKRSFDVLSSGLWQSTIFCFENFREIVRSLWNLNRNLTEGKLVKFKEKVRAELYKIEIKSNDFVHDDHNFVFNYLGKNQIDEWAKTIWKSFLTHVLNCLFSSTGSELGKGNGSNGRKWFWLSWHYYHHPIYLYAYLSCTCYVEEAWQPLPV